MSKVDKGYILSDEFKRGRDSKNVEIMKVELTKKMEELNSTINKIY